MLFFTTEKKIFKISTFYYQIFYLKNFSKNAKKTPAFIVLRSLPVFVGKPSSKRCWRCRLTESSRNYPWNIILIWKRYIFINKCIKWILPSAMPTLCCFYSLNTPLSTHRKSHFLRNRLTIETAWNYLFIFNIIWDRYIVINMFIK